MNIKKIKIKKIKFDFDLHFPTQHLVVSDVLFKLPSQDLSLGHVSPFKEEQESKHCPLIQQTSASPDLIISPEHS